VFSFAEKIKYISVQSTYHTAQIKLKTEISGNVNIVIFSR